MPKNVARTNSSEENGSRMTKLITDYLKKVEKEASRGVATEHTYRPALQCLVEALEAGIAAVNEPKRQRGRSYIFII